MRYDLIVVGGGFAGVCAAIAAARQGLKVLLTEKGNCLGGAACHGLVNPFMPYVTNLPETGETRRLCNGIFREITERLHKEGGMVGGENSLMFDEEILKLVLNRMALEEGVSLLYHVTVVRAILQDGKIAGVECAGRSGLFELEADYFIDATGDAELAVLCGCPFHLGRAADQLCQPMTLCFRMSGVDKEKYQANRAKINPLYKQFQQEGKIRNIREDVLIFDNMNDGVLHFNSTRVVRKNPTDPFDYTQAELEAREQVFELRDFLRDNIEGFENCRVLSTAMQIGVRESRMIDGLYTITAEEMKALCRFDDAIAVGNYDIDIHNPEGSGTSHYYFKPGEWYEIPYRCLIPQGADNLLVTGRCISSTHEAQASYRIMPIVANLGEAAGVAIGVAAKAHAKPVDADTAEIRRILREGGALL